MDIVERLTVRNMPYGSLALIDEAAKEIVRLRATLNDILLLDGKHLTGRQKFAHAVIIAERAYRCPLGRSAS